MVYIVKILEQSKRPKLAVLENSKKQVLITKTAGKTDPAGEFAAKVLAKMAGQLRDNQLQVTGLKQEMLKVSKAEKLAEAKVKRAAKAKEKREAKKADKAK